MKIFGLAGWSGSGKTTLLVKLIPALIARGFTVSTIKHAHHAFDIDTPGKDSHAHRLAGASEVMVSSSQRYALMGELRGAPEPSVEELAARMAPVDLLLVEGFRHHAYDKLEIHRPALGKPELWPNDRNVVAVASDVALAGVTLPTLPLEDAAAIAQFIIEHCGLAAAAARRAAG